MKFLTTTALALIAVTAPANAQYGSSYSGQPGATAVPQQPQQQKQQPNQQAAPANQPQPSAKARKAILDLQTAVAANDTATIPAKLAAAQAVASTKEDRYWIAINQLKAAAKANDLATEAAAVNDLATSGLMPATELAGIYSELGGRYYNAKQYDQAVAAFQRQAQLDPLSTDPLTNIAQIRAAQGRSAEALAALQQLIQSGSAGGKKPDEALYRRALAIAYEAKSPAAMDLARQWVAAYPSDTSWHDTLAIYRNLHPSGSPEVFDLLRLGMATNALQQAGDYNLYAAKAFDQQNYGEAKAVVDAGIAAGKLKTTDPDVSAVLTAVKGKVPTEGELAAAEKGAAIATAYLRVGDRYYGAGNYAKAAALYKEALAKGTDANLTNLRLGEALARSGDKAGATAALSAVGSGPQAEVAKLWLLYVQRQA